MKKKSLKKRIILFLMLTLIAFGVYISHNINSSSTAKEYIPKMETLLQYTGAVNMTMFDYEDAVNMPEFSAVAVFFAAKKASFTDDEGRLVIPLKKAQEAAGLIFENAELTPQSWQFISYDAESMCFYLPPAPLIDYRVIKVLSARISGQLITAQVEIIAANGEWHFKNGENTPPSGEKHTAVFVIDGENLRLRSIQ